MYNYPCHEVAQGDASPVIATFQVPDEGPIRLRVKGIWWGILAYSKTIPNPSLVRTFSVPEAKNKVALQQITSRQQR